MDTKKLTANPESEPVESGLQISMDGATTTITTSESELRTQSEDVSEEHGTDELLDGGGRYTDGTNSKNEEREAHHVEECGEIDENMPIEKEEYEEGRGEKEEEEEEEQKRFVHTLEAVSSEDSIPSSLEADESGGVSMNEEQEEEESHDGEEPIYRHTLAPPGIMSTPPRAVKPPKPLIEEHIEKEEMCRMVEDGGMDRNSEVECGEVEKASVAIVERIGGEEKQDNSVTDQSGTMVETEIDFQDVKIRDSSPVQAGKEESPNPVECQSEAPPRDPQARNRDSPILTEDDIRGAYHNDDMEAKPNPNPKPKPKPKM